MMKLVRFIGTVVLVWLCVATARYYDPVPMTHIDGAVPEQKTYQKACAFDEAGMKTCRETSFYLWRLPAGGTITTTWKPGRSDIEIVTGTLIHESHECPDSRIEWSIVTDRNAGGTLTDDDPKAQLNIPVQQSVRHITLSLRRLDTVTCASALRWVDPRLQPRYKLLP
ncbi:hypothetical protein ABZ897_59090 [Nonomuraea sp. NPDC046802]|uniref:hypothetical protein n=1 Tax=Nonomuraea sp. NPDC046802 TaxID=3154919 RepID=UPI0033FA1949